jgi:hypothetical protein
MSRKVAGAATAITGEKHHCNLLFIILFLEAQAHLGRTIL